MKDLAILKSDPWLAPYANAINGRYEYFESIEKKLVADGQTLSDFASGYLYFGLHRLTDGWVFREWAPNATAIFLIGDFNNWQRRPDYQLKKLQNGIWEIRLPDFAMAHSQLYKLLIEWEGGSGERIPAWARRVVQDEIAKRFLAHKFEILFSPTYLKIPRLQAANRTSFDLRMPHWHVEFRRKGIQLQRIQNDCFATHCR